MREVVHVSLIRVPKLLLHSCNPIHGITELWRLPDLWDRTKERRDLFDYFQSIHTLIQLNAFSASGLTHIQEVLQYTHVSHVKLTT